MLWWACRHLCQVDISGAQLQQPGDQWCQQCIQCRFVLLSAAIQLHSQRQYQLTHISDNNNRSKFHNFFTTIDLNLRISQALLWSITISMQYKTCHKIPIIYLLLTYRLMCISYFCSHYYLQQSCSPFTTNKMLAQFFRILLLHFHTCHNQHLISPLFRTWKIKSRLLWRQNCAR